MGKVVWSENKMRNWLLGTIIQEKKEELNPIRKKKCMSVTFCGGFTFDYF